MSLLYENRTKGGRYLIGVTWKLMTSNASVEAGYPIPAALTQCGFLH